MWSECSWVMRMAVRDSGSTLMAARRSKVSLRERPASTRMRVLSVATRVELPFEDEARTETCRMMAPLGDYGVLVVGTPIRVGRQVQGALDSSHSISLLWISWRRTFSDCRILLVRRTLALRWQSYSTCSCLQEGVQTPCVVLRG